MTDLSYLDLARAAAAEEPDLSSAVLGAVRRGRYVLGDEVRAFESEWAAACGVARAVGVASGTDAITLALTALGVGAGDEVLTVSMTCAPTAAGIRRAGATPVFVDVEDASLTMDASLLARAVTPRTRAVLPVHLYGRVADVDAIAAFARERGLLLVEDCAQ
ncbi:MAG TPA: aminotransferase class I/II-fold pyridoxal phosphate-dependent enzyme, partial [Thermoanaerobaculia bacterium]|nr:aminotransferase class I/II-fold pyridoxal phosphate-dependent enzyme [Thermoanaerobaculia bacterium]